ncbi:MAG: hypothetical protein QOF96_388 [Actinomycetota bacterium]|nr:hypothetical protein [Actinomycetota bacterium]
MERRRRRAATSPAVRRIAPPGLASRPKADDLGAKPPPQPAPDQSVEAAPAAGPAALPPDEERRLRSALESARLVVAPTTVFSGVLFYFGWVYTAARAFYFGIDPSTLGYSNQDYVLRSADAVFLPAVTLLIVGLGLLWAHSLVWRRIAQGARPQQLRFALRAVALAGFLVLVDGATGVVGRPLVGPRSILTPLNLGTGVGLIAYAVSMQRKFAGPLRHDPERSPSWLPSVSATVVILILVVTLFAAVGDWAHVVGTDRARQLVQRIGTIPSVVVYSPQRLQLDATGVRVETVGGSDSAYRFRYSGLKLLIRSGGKYFLIPAQWTPADGVVIPLPDRNELRFEFTPG